MTALFTVSFNGASFNGWQRQPEFVGEKYKRTVEGELAKAFSSLGENTVFSACSRTDSGVHALKFLFTAPVSGRIPIHKMPDALNGQLQRLAGEKTPVLRNMPGFGWEMPDICVMSAREVPDGFNLRKSVLSKTYVYRIYSGNAENPRYCPFLRDFAYYRRVLPDAVTMNSAAQMIAGRHDFRGFMKSDPRNVPDSTVKTVFEVSVSRTELNVFFLSGCSGGIPVTEIRVRGSGFLYNMMRIIAGTLISDSPEKRIRETLDTLDRNKAGITAPACGLWLEDTQLEEMIQSKTH